METLSPLHWTLYLSLNCNPLGWLQSISSKISTLKIFHSRKNYRLLGLHPQRYKRKWYWQNKVCYKRTHSYNIYTLISMVARDIKRVAQKTVIKETKGLTLSLLKFIRFDFECYIDILLLSWNSFPRIQLNFHYWL